MSLFKIHQWFNYQCPGDESDYDSLSLTCARLNTDNEHQKENIVVTSHSGHISILQPLNSEAENANNEFVEQQPNHSSIIYEAKLEDPILGVLCGNFIHTQKQMHQNNNIAILHPRKLVIYSIATTGNSEHGQQTNLHIITQHDLKKSAFTLCKGNFGGVKGKEFICVMFLDGSLKFFEQDGISHDCVLPGNRTIPTNFIYVSRTDCFIILAPNWDLECYRYLSLSESFERKFSPIWSLNIGEYVLDMNSHQINNNESLIVLLGENNLICVSDTGKMKFIKKLDYTPLSFFSFVVGWYFEPDCKLMIAVATDNYSLLIYNNSTLVWCTELLGETVSIRRGNFISLTGALVTMSSTGNISVGFLGSDPQMFKVPPINLSKLSYEKSKLELEEMEKEINSSVDNSDVPFINASAEKDLQVKTHLQFDNLSDGEFAKLQVKLLATVNLEQVQLVIVPNATFSISKSVYFFQQFNAHEKSFFETSIFTNETQVSELFLNEFTILVSFINKQSIARVLKHNVEIPLKAILTKSSPQKDGLFKVTLTGAMDLADVFKDLNFETGQAFGLKSFNTESITTLIVAKNTDRYRLQSNSVASLALILSILTTREVNSRRGQISVKSTPPPVIEFLLTTFEKHNNLNIEIKSINENLKKKTIEMRLFERCFLVKMQGKKPTNSTDGVNLLLRENYEEICQLTNKCKKLKVDIERVNIQLKSALYLIRKVIKNSELQQPKVKEDLLSIARPMLTDFQEQSWIEAVSPFVDYLNRLYQAKGNTNQLYDMTTFRNDNFSITRFMKQMKNVLALILDNSVESMKAVEETLAEEPESRDNSEWSSSINPAHETLLEENDK